MLVSRSKDTSNNLAWNASIKTSSGPVPIGIGTPLLPICLSQEYHEGEKLKAIIDLLQRSQKIFVLVSGALYRHTIQITESLTYKEACEKAMERGEEWESQHRSILDSSRTQMAIYKWENWLLHERYPSIRKQLEEFYITEPDFKQAFDLEASIFMERLEKKSRIEATEKNLSICLDYLKEECTVFVLMHKITPYTHFVYPGSASKAIDSTFKRYNLQISIVRPEFSLTNAQSVKYISVPFNKEDRLKGIFNRDEQAKVLSDRSEVLGNCRVFLLKSAPPCIRDKAAVDIETHVTRSEVNLELHRRSDPKTTLLIFSPKGKYPTSKFDEEQSKNYIPSEKLDFGMLCSFSSTLAKRGVINLRYLEVEEASKCAPIKSRIMNEKSRIMNDLMTELPLKDVCAALWFHYSRLVYRGIAPDAKFFIINDDGQYKLYSSHIDGVIDKMGALRAIIDFLSNLDSNSAFNLLEINTEPQLVININNPFSLAKLIFETSERTENMSPVSLSRVSSGSSSMASSPSPPPIRGDYYTGPLPNLCLPSSTHSSPVASSGPPSFNRSYSLPHQMAMTGYRPNSVVVPTDDSLNTTTHMALKSAQPSPTRTSHSFKFP